MVKLGVNIDHIATIRQARKTYEPDPVTAALLADIGGADVITIHLREDRRHIQDRDLKILRETIFTKLNLEMALSKEIIDLALKVKPEQVTFVPEKREEITTEGGLDVIARKALLHSVVSRFKDSGIIVSFFVEPEPGQIMASREIGADYVELHTGGYANAKSCTDRQNMLMKLRVGVENASRIGLGVNAGHGLTYKNVGPIVEELKIEELHIGHSIVARALFVGIKEAVREMKEIIYRHECHKKY